MKTSKRFQRLAVDQHRAYVGAADLYDKKAAWQFMIMALLGLRENHDFLEIGCGSMRAGRLFMIYLNTERYHGLDASEDAILQGMHDEIGLIGLHKEPTIIINEDFDLGKFNKQFDYILCHSIFMHIPLHEVRTIMREVAQVLKPKGIFAANYIDGEQFRGKRTTYPQMVTHHTMNIRAAANDAGLQFNPFVVKERHASGRWFICTQPGYKPFTAPGVGRMLKGYWNGT